MNVLITYFHQAFTQDNSDEKRIAAEIHTLATNAGHKAEILSFPFDLNQSDDLKLIYSYNSLLIDNTSLLISINSPACYLSHDNHYSIWTKAPEVLLEKLLSELKTVFLLDKNLINKAIDAGIKQTNLESYSEVKRIFKKL